MENIEAICVYCASSNHISPVYKETAHLLGRMIAESGHPMVCGGGRAGLMSEVTDGVLSAGGTAIGVLPQFMIERHWEHPDLTEMIVRPDMHSRKRTMAEMSMAAIALPGGCGTLDELMEIITWRQLGLFKGKVVILNTEGYYDPLLAMFHRIAEEGFMRKSTGRLWHVASTPREALEMALTPDNDAADYIQKID